MKPTPAMIAAAHDVTMKQCSICNQHKPADAYRGTRSACRECENARRREWYAAQGDALSEASPLERLVMPVAVAVVRPFIEEHHYSKSINGCKVSMAFALYEAGEMVGAVLFGPLSTTAWKRYGEREADVVELRRLVCLDRCPHNTESWLIAKCLKVLKRQTGYKVCVSYADPHHGHCGTIYQAANWNYEGQTAPDVLLQTPEGRLYHSRALRTKYNGDFKPFVKRLRKLQEDGLLTEVAVPGKHIYTYALQGKQQPTRLPYPKVHNRFHCVRSVKELK